MLNFARLDLVDCFIILKPLIKMSFKAQGF